MFRKTLPNYGYFIKDLAGAVAGGDDFHPTAEAVYLRIADDRLSRNLLGWINENELMRRYDVSRIVLRRILVRISAEGWIERNKGRGWRFATLG